MADLNVYDHRREELKRRYLSAGAPAPSSVRTGGVDHLALISSDLDATIRFYTEIIGLRLTRVVQNRDDPTSTHIFLDIGGGNSLAFFDFPEKGPSRTTRGVGSMHHIALKISSAQMGEVLKTLEERQVPYSMHGSAASGSIYLRDPDQILVELTTGY